MPTFRVTDSETGITLRLEGDSPPTEQELEEIFERVRQEQAEAQTGADVSGLTFRPFGVETGVELPESLTAGLVGAGRGLTTVARGLGLAEPEEQVVTEQFEQLKEASPVATTVGEIAGEAAPFLIPGAGAAGRVGQLGLAGRAAATGALGAAESGIIARGQGADSLQQLGAALAGGSVGAGLELVLPRAARIARGLFRQRKGRAPTGQLIDAEGNPTEELNQFLAESGESFEDIVRQTRADFEARGAPTQQAIQEELARDTIPGRPSQTITTEFGIEQKAQQAGTTPTEFAAPELSPLAQSNLKLDDLSKAIAGADTTKVTEEARTIADALELDEAVVNSAQRLDIEMPLTSASKNRAIAETAQAAKSRPQSQLSENEARAIDQTKAKVDEFIGELRGGEISAAGFDQKLADDFDDNIRRTQQNANRAFNVVNRAIPRNTAVQLQTAKELADRLKADVGGDLGQLEQVERDLINIVNRQDKKQKVTYDALDRVRRNIGRGFERQGVYQDIDDKILAEVYSALSQDQIRIADEIGQRINAPIGDALRDGNRFIAQQKDLQKTSQKLFGRELEKSILPRIDNAANRLVRGDTKAFNVLMRRIPEQFRAEAAALTVDKIFATGKRGGGGLSEGFVRGFNNLNRNPEAKRALFEHLPREAINTFNDIGNVWTGLIRSKALENKSKTARDLLAALPGDGIQKILGVADTASRLPVARFGGFATSVVQGLKDNSKTAIQKADDFLTSRAFDQAVKEAAVAKTEKRIADINAKLAKTESFKRWAGTLSREQQQELRDQGFIGWFTTPIAAAAATPETEPQPQEAQ